MALLKFDSLLFHFGSQLVWNRTATAIFLMGDMPFNSLFECRFFGHPVFLIPGLIDFHVSALSN
jgi:hypothetical protein